MIEVGMAARLDLNLCSRALYGSAFQSIMAGKERLRIIIDRHGGA
jgi:hypothetical protein